MFTKPQATRKELTKLMASAKINNPADLKDALEKSIGARNTALDKKEFLIFSKSIF